MGRYTFSWYFGGNVSKRIGQSYLHLWCTEASFRNMLMLPEIELTKSPLTIFHFLIGSGGGFLDLDPLAAFAATVHGLQRAAIPAGL